MIQMNRKWITYPIMVAMGFFAGGAGARLAPRVRAHFTALQPTASAPASEARAARERAEIKARRGAESPELRALRMAEADIFADMSPIMETDEGGSPNPGMAPRFQNQGNQGNQSNQSNQSPAPRRQSSSDDDTSIAWKGLRMPAFPVRHHPRVAKYIHYFTQTQEGRKTFVTWLRRSGRYREVITSALRERHMPEDLIALVFVESGFWPTALSSAGAVGLWQFMPQTARSYGLVVSPRCDERRSLWRSTEAAVAHLRDLHERFQSWDLALAAYNMGYKQLTDRMGRMGVDDFWSLSMIDGAMPRETALYVPKILAVSVILQNLEAFQLHDVELAAPVDSSEMDVPAGTSLATIARAAGTSTENMRSLNLEFLRGVITDEGRQPTVHIPSGGLARARVLLPRLLESDGGEDRVSSQFDWGKDEASRGHTRLEGTAPGGGAVSYYQVDPNARRDPPASRGNPDNVSDALAATAPKGRGLTDPSLALNPMPTSCVLPGGGLGTGAACSAPGVAAEPSAPPPAADTNPAPAADSPAPKAKKRTMVVFYRVAPGDTVESIASTFHVKPSVITSQTDFRVNDRLERGVLLRLVVPKTNVTSLKRRTQKQP